MTARSLILLGGGEHARVVEDAARSRPGEWEVLGYVAPDEEAQPSSGLRRLGDDEYLEDCLEGERILPRPWLVVAFGGAGRAGGAGGPTRRRIVERYGARARWATIVHATAWVSPTAELAEGCVVMAGAIVNSRARVGHHAIVNSGALIEHDVEVGAFAHVGPAASVGGGARVGEDAFLGLGALVRDHVRIGSGAIVGMGAVVVSDVAAGVVVMGNPAAPRTP